MTAFIVSLVVLALGLIGSVVGGFTHDEAVVRFSVNVARIAGLAAGWTGWRLYRRRTTAR